MLLPTLSSRSTDELLWSLPVHCNEYVRECLESPGCALAAEGSLYQCGTAALQEQELCK